MDQTELLLLLLTGKRLLFRVLLLLLLLRTEGSKDGEQRGKIRSAVAALLPLFPTPALSQIKRTVFRTKENSVKVQDQEKLQRYCRKKEVW